jgi:hypothetical protein
VTPSLRTQPSIGSSFCLQVTGTFSNIVLPPSASSFSTSTFGAGVSAASGPAAGGGTGGVGMPLPIADDFPSLVSTVRTLRVSRSATYRCGGSIDTYIIICLAPAPPMMKRQPPPPAAIPATPSIGGPTSYRLAPTAPRRRPNSVGGTPTVAAGQGEDIWPARLQQDHEGMRTGVVRERRRASPSASMTQFHHAAAPASTTAMLSQPSTAPIPPVVASNGFGASPGSLGSILRWWPRHRTVSAYSNSKTPRIQAATAPEPGGDPARHSRRGRDAPEAGEEGHGEGGGHCEGLSPRQPLDR